MKYKTLERIIFFMGVAGLWYSGIWVLAGLVTVLYFFRYTAYEVVFMGWCLDIQFMTGDVPWYTLAFAGLFLCIEWLKPHLVAYTN